jgi:predicted phage-related endonuclease
MDATRITPDSEAHWLELRKANLNSTDVPALFGASPYLSYFELFHVKSGTIEADFEEDDRIRWGRRLEAVIAYGVAEDLGLIVEPFKDYLSLPLQRVGSSFDFIVTGIVDDFYGDQSARDMFREYGPGLVEVKNVDGFVFKKTWIDGDGDDDSEAPPHIEIQVQHQMLVSGLSWALITPLVGGNRPRPIIRRRDEELGAMILERAEEFWTRVENEDAPDPDFKADSDVISRLFRSAGGGDADMSDNDHLVLLCEQYQVASSTEKGAEARKREIKAEILTIIGNYDKVRAGNFKISAGEVKANPGTLITPDHVGTYIGGRKAYRGVRISG